MVTTNDKDESKKTKKASTRRNSRKKSKDKPKRPLSAYNYFFKQERQQILKYLARDTNAEPTMDQVLNAEEEAKLLTDAGKASFEEIGRLIGKRWKEISPESLEKYTSLASTDAERYKREVKEYNERKEKSAAALAAESQEMKGGPRDPYGHPQSFYGGPGMHPPHPHGMYPPGVYGPPGYGYPPQPHYSGQPPAYGMDPYGPGPGQPPSHYSRPSGDYGHSGQQYPHAASQQQMHHSGGSHMQAGQGDAYGSGNAGMDYHGQGAHPNHGGEIHGGGGRGQGPSPHPYGYPSQQGGYGYGMPSNPDQLPQSMDQRWS